MRSRYPEGFVLYRNLNRAYPSICSGKGAYLYDDGGNEYLDASGGAAVVNVGHGVQEIAAAVFSQAKSVGYVSGLQFTHPAVERLAEQAAEFLPYDSPKLFFVSSGSEAIEAAIKLARQYWLAQGHARKFRVISRQPSYHGNTLAALSLSAREHYAEAFRPMLFEASKIPAPYCYRCPWHEAYPGCGVRCAWELEREIVRLGEDTVSAFVTEVIGGASLGAAVPPVEYFQIVRKICDDHRVLLIVDEVMTGIGRTGKWLACDHFSLVPDVTVLGKGLAGGYFPLSALAVNRRLVDALAEKKMSFLHAQTFVHHPVGCAAASATLDYILANDLVSKCRETGFLLREALETLASDPQVGDIRGQGLLLGIEFVEDRETREPFPRKDLYAEQFCAKALDRGLVLWANIGHADGLNGDLILLAPPFTIGPREIKRIVETLGQLLAEMRER